MCVVMVMSVVMAVVIRWRCVRRYGFVSPSLSSDSSRFPGFLGLVFCRGGLQPLGHLRWLQLFLVEVSAVCVHFMNMIVVMFMITVVAVVVIRVRLRRQVPVVNLLVFVLFIMCVIVIVVVVKVMCVMLMVILLYLSVIVIVIVIMFMVMVMIMIVIMFMLCGSTSSGLAAPSGSSFCVWMLRVLFLVWTHLCGVTVPVALALAVAVAVAVASVSG